MKIWVRHLKTGKCPRGAKESRRGKSGMWCKIRNPRHMSGSARPKLSGAQKKNGK